MCDEKVLLISGDPELCEQAADFLWEEGFKVESAGDAGDWAERMQAGEFDIIILDRKLGGTGGLETAEQIKALAPEARVFATGARPFTNIMLMAESVARLVAGGGNGTARGAWRAGEVSSFLLSGR